ncbi:MAG TPA: uroporphyrinogen-III C-methyltransferase [Gemmatimonadales bacterium]|nr:uroporphyrinogen-III C-methyltransferase [Gemmatimonadales bacterium]
MSAAPPRPRTAIVLAAHGSRRDPAANALVAARAAALARRGVADRVVAAFHQGSPGFARALDQLDAEQVLVVPFFTSEGYYTRRILPEALRRSARFDPRRVRQAPALGVHPAMAGLVAERARTVAAHYDLSLERTAVIVVGHGTRRHRQSRAATLALASALAEQRIGAEVRAAFLDDVPPIEAALAQVASRQVLVIPFLIGGGRHASGDLPRRLGLGAEPAPRRITADGRQIVLDVPIGQDERLLDLVADLAARELAQAGSAVGTVALVGAGPGDPGLLTVRGLRLLREADVVLHDRLIAPELLREARPGARVIDVGKAPGRAPMSQSAINRLLVEHARRGARVVRLKGGDPFVFGRGSEEQDACREAGIPCVVVPGVSSAIAVPAAAGIPLTARGLAASFGVVTGRLESGADVAGLAARAAALDTVVILMSRAGLGELTRALIAAGKHPETPAAAIQEGTTPRQRVVTATVATLAEAVDRAGLGAPMVAVIGAVAARAREAAPC